MTVVPVAGGGAMGAPMNIELSSCVKRCQESDKKRSEKDQRRIDNFDKFAARWAAIEKAEQAGGRGRPLSVRALPVPSADQARVNRAARMAKMRARGMGHSRKTVGATRTARSAPTKLRGVFVLGGRQYTATHRADGTAFIVVKGKRRTVNPGDMVPRTAAKPRVSAKTRPSAVKAKATPKVRKVSPRAVVLKAHDKYLSEKKAAKAERVSARAAKKGRKRRVLTKTSQRKKAKK